LLSLVTDALCCCVLKFQESKYMDQIISHGLRLMEESASRLADKISASKLSKQNTNKKLQETQPQLPCDEKRSPQPVKNQPPLLLVQLTAASLGWLATNSPRPGAPNGRSSKSLFSSTNGLEWGGGRGRIWRGI